MLYAPWFSRLRAHPSMRRRDFLRHAWTASAALAVLPLRVSARPPHRAEPGHAPKKILIVGAGLAGLSAAYELTRGGHDVTLLEARTRAGGRVFTLRDGFAEGLFVEAGAARIPDHHDFTLRYAELFGLSLDPFEPLGQRSRVLRPRKADFRKTGREGRVAARADVRGAAARTHRHEGENTSAPC